MAVTTEILSGYEEILQQRTNNTIAENVVLALLDSPFVLLMEPTYRWQLITIDADGNKFVDCAVAVNADFLISNDRHFKVLVGSPKR